MANWHVLVLDGSPARNRRDFDEIPQGARDKLEFIWLERVDDAVAAAFEEGPLAVAATCFAFTMFCISESCGTLNVLARAACGFMRGR
jgi:hypothetical protein